MAIDIARRKFIAALGGTALAWPLAARAQQLEPMRRIGALSGVNADDAEGQADLAAFLQGLQQLGWTDGRNVHIDTRWGAGNDANIRKYAAELVALAPDVLLSTGSALMPFDSPASSHRSRNQLPKLAAVLNG
jgi:putative tryptophan/tyrosine transport system substrate-binding protein